LRIDDRGAGDATGGRAVLQVQPDGVLAAVPMAKAAGPALSIPLTAAILPEWRQVTAPGQVLCCRTTLLSRIMRMPVQTDKRPYKTATKAIIIALLAIK
jgi:hypothetical protein